MKKVLKAFVVMLLMATVLNASSLKESLNVDGYNLELTSKRDFLTFSKKSKNQILHSTNPFVKGF